MADTNVSNTESNTDENTGSTSQTSANKDEDIVAKLVQEKVAESLKDIKGKLDNAYAARDEALAKAAKLEQERKEEQLKRLQEEGKHKEALELQLAQERAEKDALKQRNTELTRDVLVRSALSGLEFRNERAAEIAYKEVVSQVVQKEDGSWVHKSGVSIPEYISVFAKDEEQAFLFKVKANSGGGSSATTAGVPSSSSNKSLFAMSQEEVLKLAAEGKLAKRK